MNNHSRHIRLVFLAFCLILLAQRGATQPVVQWDKTFGGSGYDALTTATKTNDDGFLLVGNSSSPADGRDVTQAARGSSDFWIVKMDTLGRKSFDARFGGSGLEICNKVIQNTEGYLLIGGSESPADGDKTEPNRGGRDIWIVQIRPDGTKVWDKTFGGKGNDEAYNAVVTDNGNAYIIVGHSDSPAGGDKTEASRGDLDLWILKIDKNGNKLWDKTFGGSGSDDYPTAFTATKDGNFVVGCGSTSGISGEKTGSLRGIKDVWVLKFDKNGNKIWDKTYGGDLHNTIFDLQELNDASIMLACNSDSPISGDKTAENFGGYDYWVIKIRPDGSKIWDKTYGGAANDFIVALDQNKTNYVLLAGQSISRPSGNKHSDLQGVYDFWIVYIDEQGNEVWDKNIGGSGNDAAFELIKFQDGAYLICGGSTSDRSGDKSENARGKNADGSNTDDFWVAKIKCIFELNLGNDTLVCRTAPVSFDATIPNCPNCQYEWSNGSTASTITVRPTETMNLRVKVTATDACVVKDDISLVVIPSPDFANYTIQPPRCHDGNDGVIALDRAHGGTPPYFLVINQDTFARQIFIDKRTAGTYNVSLVDRKGCRLDANVSVPNPPPFILTLPDSRELPFGDSFRLNVTTNRPLSNFYWSDRSIHSLDTIVKPFDSQTYSIFATDALGCAKTAAMQVTIRRDNLFFAPQAFSPNGDGRNDFYQLFGGKTVVSIDHFKIFDRWGSLLFANERIYPAHETDGWDGRFRGTEMSEGVYVFIAEVTYIDGRKELIKGDLTLFR